MSGIQQIIFLGIISIVPQGSYGENNTWTDISRYVGLGHMVLNKSDGAQSFPFSNINLVPLSVLSVPLFDVLVMDDSYNGGMGVVLD